eukprot:TRINITY_DN76862_c0_g1_i1.p1 TRINITY_DN76862_c0_g1~~TRINITY_DN76862_c0_g1_i1.p1  ORF type:complete len:257 (-),score=107.69 TRINITY_DN76862_c0_g1_i1:241-1011(-)
MTNYQEEQELEIEALTSIYEENKEFKRISDTEFTLHLLPFPDKSQENHVQATLHITYGPEYPDTPPDWELEKVGSIPEDKLPSLKKVVEEVIDSSLGMAMVYSMAEVIQDWLKENNTKMLSMHEEMMQRLGPQEGDEEEDEDDDDEEEEEQEWKGLADKPIVPEKDRITEASFTEWKKKFEEEMYATGVLKKEEERSQSGKQFFLAAKAAEDKKATGSSIAGTSPTGTDGGTPMVYDASLFGEVEDDDLDDLSGGE